jgi:hypothetical protein
MLTCRFHTAAVGLLAAVLAVAQDTPARPDFSGEWRLDLMRTRFNEVTPPKSVIWTIDHEEPKLTITITRETDSGRFTDTLHLVTDGSEQQATVAGQPATVSATWDDPYLIVRTVRQTASGSSEMVRRFKLGDKGKILTNVLTVKDTSGEKKAYEFYMKAGGD